LLHNLGVHFQKWLALGEGSMKENRVKRTLGEGGLALGTHVGGIADPQIVEFIGWRVSTPPSSTLSTPPTICVTCRLAVMAAEHVGITPIVPTPGFDPAFILRLLDMGVQGIQVPHVGSTETACEAVQPVRQGDAAADRRILSPRVFNRAGARLCG
jgi:hypothetical protein